MNSTEITKALAKHFEVSQKDFVTVEADGQQVVVYSAPSGIYRGSYDEVMTDKNLVVKIGKEKVDTRTAMTWPVYEALAKKAQIDHVGLPTWTSTWLTGEAPHGSNADAGSVCDGEPNRRWDNRGYGRDDLRVRPAVIIPKPSKLDPSPDSLPSELTINGAKYRLVEG